MVYEAVLLFGVVVAAGFPVVVLVGIRQPPTDPQRWLLQGVSFLVIGAYFVYCWSRSGQTLAMRSWRLKLVEQDGGPVSAQRALLRYVLAWHLFVPGIVFVALFQAHSAVDAAAFALGFAAMLALAYVDPRRQLLHDRVLGTRVIVTGREAKAAADHETAPDRH